MGYSVGEGLDAVIAVISTVFSMLGNGISIAVYVLGALGLYTIAKRRGINNPWLAWVPVVRGWTIGSLSDQYRYVKHGQVKNKRKWLMVLECLMAVMILAAVILLIVNVVKLTSATAMTEDAYMAAAVSMLLQFVLLWLGIMAVAIARAIIHFMAMYDIYTSLDPAYSLVYLLVSIFVNVTEPFFVFFNRNKDLGMPPRKDATPAYVEEA